MFNLFDVTRSIEAPLSSKPRQANDREVGAYAQWLRQRRGLPDMGRTELHFTENRQGRRYERGHCIGATFGDYTSNANRREYEPGAYSIIMPGHDMHCAAVTFETLDDSGEVERSQAQPAEPLHIGQNLRIVRGAGLAGKRRFNRARNVKEVEHCSSSFSCPWIDRAGGRAARVGLRHRRTGTAPARGWRRL